MSDKDQDKKTPCIRWIYYNLRSKFCRLGDLHLLGKLYSYFSETLRGYSKSVKWTRNIAGKVKVRRLINVQAKPKWSKTFNGQMTFAKAVRRIMVLAIINRGNDDVNIQEARGATLITQFHQCCPR